MSIIPKIMPLLSLTYTNWILGSAYHVSVQEASIHPPEINTPLPLFVESIHSVAMIKHTMTIVKEVVQYLNPGQAPVLSTGQPLFTLIVLCSYLARYTRRELCTL